MEYVPDDHVTATFSRPADDQPLKPFDVPERFSLVGPLGRGGQGSVWLAEDRTLDQRIALKVIDLEERERTIQEARMGRDLDHPHLLRIFDLVEQSNRLILVMEWLQGGSVKETLRDGPLPITEVVAIADQVLQALAYLHDRGIVHRDIKPSNILRERSGRIKLGDLGLVREIESTADMTRSGLAIGTPDYMSPEQLQGETPAAPADLYALGATLYELLCAAKPFADSSDLAIANHHIRSRPPWVRSRRPDCPRWLAAFVARLLEKKPHDRWKDAGAALSALRRQRAPRWRLWRQRATMAAALTLAAFVGWKTIATFTPQLETAVVEGYDVAGIDHGGAELWRTTFDDRPTSSLVANLTASRGLEVAVGIRKIEPDTGLRRAAIAVLDDGGNEIHRFEVDPRTIQERYPFLTADLQGAVGLAGDLDGDQRPDLVWSASHPEWYPTIVGVWWGHRGGTVQPLLVNSGRVFSYAVGDADGDQEPELVVTGVNNPIGYQDFLAVVEPGRILISPDLLRYDLDRTQHTYLPLGQNAGRIAIEKISFQTIEVRQPSGPGTIHIGGSSEAGRDRVGRAERQSFWQQVMALCRDARAQPAVAEHGLQTLRNTFSSILDEPGSRLAVDLLFSRSLARAGDHRRAIAHLREATLNDPELIDTWLRLGEQLLIAGDREAGRQALRRSMVARTVGRNPYDAMLFLTLDAALHDSPEDLEEARHFWTSYTGTKLKLIHYDPIERLADFFGGRWKDLDPGNIPVSYYRPMKVIEPWIRLERGTDPLLILERASDLAANPEIKYTAHMLEAMALLRLGRTEEAEVVANTALERITELGREHYEHFIWVPVAEWVCGQALEASGNSGAAHEHYVRAARTAPNAWFADSARSGSAR